MPVKIVLSMIVKNEQSNLPRCLGNVGHLIDAIAIVDTGSRDKTIEIAKTFMRERRIPGDVIYHDKLIDKVFDFGYSRTVALRAAESVAYRVSAGHLRPPADCGPTSHTESSPAAPAGGAGPKAPPGADSGGAERSQSDENSPNPDTEAQSAGEGQTADKKKKKKKKRAGKSLAPPVTDPFSFGGRAIDVADEEGNEAFSDEISSLRAADVGCDEWYVMFMDADNLLMGKAASPEGETMALLTGVPDVIFDFRKDSLAADKYVVDMRRSNSIYDYTWLVRLDPERKKIYQWFDPRHEFLGQRGDWKPKVGKIHGCVMLSGRGGDRAKDPMTFLDDAMVFERRLRRFPNNTRWQFYLAQSWRDAGVKFYAIARDEYIKRAGMKGGWSEEVYVSWYQAGRLTLTLDPSQEGVKKAQEYFWRAFDVRPDRREASYYIINYFRLNNYFHGGWHFARSLAALPDPVEGLFMDNDIIKWRFYDEAAVCAYHAGDKPACKVLSQKALKYQFIPEASRIRIQKNVDLCK